MWLSWDNDLGVLQGMQGTKCLQSSRGQDYFYITTSTSSGLPSPAPKAVWSVKESLELGAPIWFLQKEDFGGLVYDKVGIVERWSSSFKWVVLFVQ